MAQWFRQGMRYWYVILAVIAGVLAIYSFYFLYPPPVQEILRRETVAGSGESVLEAIRAVKKKRSTITFNSLSSMERDPFQSVRPKKGKTSRKPGAGKPAPVRKYKLRGITNEKTAILVDEAGQSVIVQVGDEIDSAVVIGISSGKVTLKDRGGTFEIRMME
jgi:hypothetical protein